jgi:hypothetical protein
MRLVHYDVGKRKDGPMALCTGDERGVVCALSWFSVTCFECLTMPLGPEASALRLVAHPTPGCNEGPDREPEGPEIL